MAGGDGIRPFDARLMKVGQDVSSFSSTYIMCLRATESEGEGKAWEIASRVPGKLWGFVVGYTCPGSCKRLSARPFAAAQAWPRKGTVYNMISGVGIGLEVSNLLSLRREANQRHHCTFT